MLSPSLFPDTDQPKIAPFRGQLLKWIGNKQRFAAEIIEHFPARFGTYYEPFIGSGAVLGTLAPKRAVAGDAYAPLIEIWQALKQSPETVVDWYAERHALVGELGKKAAYASVRDAFNRSPNGADLLFLSRTCYGGVVRFRKKDGFMSTPAGAHSPMPPHRFAERARAWHDRIRKVEFVNADYRLLFDRAQSGDLIYCDPPYQDSQAILYGAQAFRLSELFDAIGLAKRRGVIVALSIDGTKKSGGNVVAIKPPSKLFAREVSVHCGRSMLRRFQMGGQSLESEEVSDRLYLTV
ncbi:Dam family site-specific DNA-(adenine-N6)-methyltransferase [Dyella tabacisoli]|uniref:Site-specific DNA-methyltransferase (adenine-specific) n=2 Tax=Dyella tabacisoli TaxID=2282381 RepID=A0A369URQ3_9GAMM|nr:Dam family site-specific DNA-(adenine-N6)-methyltransferase [Dyella tabacisoli]